MFITDDPVADFLRYDAEQEKELERLPHCAECDQRIEDEFCYQINGEILCETCMEQYRVYTSDVME